MNRLIAKGLMFGNLIAVDSPALVERYNRALKALTGQTTGLTDFHIDLSGYSPEIGDELGDDLYLNPNGCNRQFILLTTDQKTAPLLNAKFSTSRGILTRFIEENEAELFTLTARDAVAGELENTVFDLTEPKRLFDIRRVTVVADTTGNHIAEGRKLAGLIERFRTEEDGWWDDVLIAEMIGLAEKTGDVTKNPVSLKSTTFDQGNFWTAHFGGVYLFRDVEHPALISVGPRAALGTLPMKYVLDLSDHRAVAEFLDLNDLVEPIVGARGLDAGAILRQKMDFILVDAATRLGLETGAGTRRELRQVATALGPRLPEAFQGLAALLRWVETGGRRPRIGPSHPAYFYTLRARPSKDRDLVNMLLAELSPLDIRQLFICHKELFYDIYRSWPEAKKAYVADFLAREYQMDKDGTRRALFGDEPRMTVGPWDRDIVEVVGPWGAVRRERR
ncbi:DUF6638 family protein [Albidovulum sediminicola]|uniref:Uncharacterized protein n=1 Tax=Albidovulum sediminicola TaxID=2984331 RepID=A0ABT2Z4F3_9RHOB|nr:DUF6638 family protein [Defluviimonas sp. WL0075]MCV2866024.1 hypothetical protein [Defluviimonas sp. WL0075]